MSRVPFVSRGNERVDGAGAVCGTCVRKLKCCKRVRLSDGSDATYMEAILQLFPES